jgi:tetratricopeptide (TPR) repeat protein
MNEDVFVNNLKEAVQLSILEERSQVGSIRYRFTHAFFRQTLYEEMIAPQRLKLHQQVARALEVQYAKRLEEHAAELAEHFSQSTDPADLKKAVSYAEMAAKRAMDVYAYGEAVRLLEQALKVQRVLDPDDKAKQCDLLLGLCDALLSAPDTKRIIDVEASAAFSLAESIGDGSRAAKACMKALFAFVLEQPTQYEVNPQFAEWVGRADRYAMPETLERACADMFLGDMKCARGDMQTGHILLTQALDLSRRIGNQKTLWLAAGYLAMNRRAPQHTEQRMQLAEELWVSSRVGLSVSLSTTPQWIGDTFLALGQRHRAEEVVSEMRVLAQRTGHVHLALVSAAMDSVLAVMDGHLENAMGMAERIRARGEEANAAGFANIYTKVAGFRARIYLGLSLEALEREVRGFLVHDELLCLVQAHLGRKEAVSEIVDKQVVRRPNISTVEDMTADWIDSLLLEASVLIGHSQDAELLLNRFSGSGLCTPGFLYTTCIVRHLGGAAALLGRYDEARKYYQEAIKICTEMPFRPELALSRLQLTELLLEHYPGEKKEALEHLDFAIKEFREMKMQPYLEKALRHKEILGA